MRLSWRILHSVSKTVGVGACVGALPVDETRGTDKVVDDYIHDKLSELGYGGWYLTNEGLMPDIHMNLEDDDCWEELLHQWKCMGCLQIYTI